MAKSIFDYMSAEDFATYNALIEKAQENKKNAPKAPRAPRGPLTDAQKYERALKQKEKAEAKLAALMAAQNLG